MRAIVEISTRARLQFNFQVADIFLSLNALHITKAEVARFEPYAVKHKGQIGDVQNPQSTWSHTEFYLQIWEHLISVIIRVRMVKFRYN